MITPVVKDKPGGAIIANWQGRTEDVQWTTDQHGYRDCAFHVPMARREAETWYAMDGVPDLSFHEYTRPVWEGRIEQVRVGDDGLDVTAYGYRKSLDDEPFSAVWAALGTDNFALLPAAMPSRTPAKYDLGKADTLTITPKSNAKLNYGDRGEAFFVVPQGDAFPMTYLQFTYSLAAGTAYGIRATAYDRDFTTINNTDVFALNGTSTAQTATATPTLPTGTYAIGLSLVALANLPSTTTAEAVFGNIRIGRGGFPALAQTIVADCVGGPSLFAQLDTRFDLSTLGLASYDLDFDTFAVENKKPSAILDKMLDDLGVAATWAVWNDRVLSFRRNDAPRRVWYADVGDAPKVERLLSGLVNTVFATWKDVNGVARTTGPIADQRSINAQNLRRSAAVKVNASTSATAATLGAAELNTTTQQLASGSLSVVALRDAQGRRWPKHAARAGDAIVPSQFARSRRGGVVPFVIDQTTYKPDKDQLTVRIGVPLPLQTR